MALIGSLLVTGVGVLLVGLVFLDVFLTVLHPQTESPFSTRLQRGLWRGLRSLARLWRGQARHHVLGQAVPLMIAVLVVIWLCLLLIGFGLIYAAWITQPGVLRLPDSSGPPGWGDAMYFSGITLSTAGFGDEQPVHPLIRLIAVIESFSGVGVLSLSIAYVLEVYPVLQRQAVLAVLLNEETDGQVSGLPLLARYLQVQNFEALADLLRTINLELLFLAEAHRRLPVLHYAHPAEVERSFLRVLLVVRNLVAALHYGLAGGPGRAWSGDPRVLALEDSLFYALHTLGSSLHLPLQLQPMTPQHQAEVVAGFTALCAQLAALHLPTPDATSPPRAGSAYAAAQAGFVRFVLTSETPLMSYLRNSSYTYAAVTAGSPRPQRLVSEMAIDELDNGDAES